MAQQVNQYTAWCRQLFDTLTDGGSWGVPRSGLIFNRHGNTLVLVSRMPHDPAMPCTAEQLHEQQQSDYESTKREFAKAGIEVIDETENC